MLKSKGSSPAINTKNLIKFLRNRFIGLRKLNQV